VEFEIKDDFFDRGELELLREFYKEFGLRKLEINLQSQMLPHPIYDLVRRASEHLALEFNYMIIKEYNKNESFQSGAYEWHIDPDCYKGTVLFLLTVSGKANFKYKDSNELIHSVKCVPGMLMLINSDLAHKVSPPEGADNRIILFLGYNSNIVKNV